MNDQLPTLGSAPAAQGMYDPANEHDACGVGFVAHIKGKKRHEIIQQGLKILENLDHRGAVGSDKLMGDGAGILIQIPDGFSREEMAKQGVTLPPEGVFHNLVFVSIRKQYPYQAFKVMHGLWGMGQMMFSKYIVVVDEDCDVHNTSEVLFRLCANTDPARDTTVIKNPSDSLDHAPTEQNIGSHMGFDATRKLPGENYHRQWPELLKMTDEAKKLVDALQKKTR